MKETIVYTTLGIILVVCIIVGVLTWCGMMCIWVMEMYEKNPNTLFIIIPFLIFVHWFGYVSFKNIRI